MEHNLPGIITSIAVQKRNKERYSIFVDDEFLIGVMESVLLKFNLSKGVEMTPSLFYKLQREEGRSAIKSYFLNLLGRRDHARKELQTKALRKEYSHEMIENVLDELSSKGFIDDARFAEKFAADKNRLNNWGPAKIRAHLSKKGIPADIIRKSIDKTFANQDLREVFLHLVLKHKRRFLREENPLKRKKKIFDHLCRKGYRPASIHKYLDELTERIER